MEKEIIEGQITRRDFCLKACQLAALVALGGTVASALQSCNSGNTPSDVPALPVLNITPVNGIITISTASGSPLNAVGSAALVQGGNVSVLVAHTAATTFVAVTAICTHQGCIISGYSGGTYICPCHGAQYNTNGQVTRGPASAPLHTFGTSWANDVLTVAV